MPHLRLVRITLWIMAALVAAVMAFGPTTAAAHPGHEQRHHVAVAEARASAVSFDRQSAAIPASPAKVAAPSTMSAQGASTRAVFFSVPADSHDENGACNGACCSGSGCCCSACLAAAHRALVAPVGLALRQPRPQGRTPDGADPVAHLRPPTLFA